MMSLRPALLSVASAFALVAFAAFGSAQQPISGPTALTIYNGDFAVARTTVDLNLTAGPNAVTTTNVTGQLEPDSVVLRDPAGKVAFKVTEQNYDAGVIDQSSLLQKFEGKTIQFSRTTADGKSVIVDGTIIRAGNQPLIEVGGLMQFQLPGLPLFPASTNGLLLKPTLRWEIDAPKPAHFAAELAYITHGMGWQATYNVVLPESKETAATEQAQVLGWVTIQNNSGTEFPEARIKLMAGDVAKLRDMRPRNQLMAYDAVGGVMGGIGSGAGVTQQAFDDFHLYDLNRTVSLRSGETKQVQFIEADSVTLRRVYEYDGATERFQPLNADYHNVQPGYGVASGTKVAVRQEFKNSVANHLGMPLPAGRIRLYRRDAGGQMEFTGEGTITHTPTDETVKIPVGSAFDLVGERKQTDFHVDQRAHTIDETFQIVVRNQKATPASVAVVEHLNRGLNWQLTEKSTDYTKRDSNTIELPITIPPAGQTTVTYSVRYTW